MLPLFPGIRAESVVRRCSSPHHTKSVAAVRWCTPSFW